jgi:hypothetical protein
MRYGGSGVIFGGLGMLAVPLFDIHVMGGKTDELFASGHSLGYSVIAQLTAMFFIPLWSCIFSGLMFLFIKVLGFLRVDEEIEKIGIDKAEFAHTSAYTYNDLLRRSAALAQAESQGFTVGVQARTWISDSGKIQLHSGMKNIAVNCAITL